MSNILLSEEEIVFQLDRIVNMSRTEDDFPVGVLTSLDRNAWAQGYKRLTRGMYFFYCDVLPPQCFIDFYVCMFE